MQSTLFLLRDPPSLTVSRSVGGDSPAICIVKVEQGCYLGRFLCPNHAFVLVSVSIMTLNLKVVDYILTMFAVGVNI